MDHKRSPACFGILFGQVIALSTLGRWFRLLWIKTAFVGQVVGRFFTAALHGSIDTDKLRHGFRGEVASSLQRIFAIRITAPCTQACTAVACDKDGSPRTWEASAFSAVCRHNHESSHTAA